MRKFSKLEKLGRKIHKRLYREYPNQQSDQKIFFDKHWIEFGVWFPAVRNYSGMHWNSFKLNSQPYKFLFDLQYEFEKKKRRKEKLVLSNEFFAVHPWCDQNLVLKVLNAEMVD